MSRKQASSNQAGNGLKALRRNIGRMFCFIRRVYYLMCEEAGATVRAAKFNQRSLKMINRAPRNCSHLVALVFSLVTGALATGALPSSALASDALAASDPAAPADAAEAEASARAEALQVMHSFLSAFNASDEAAWARTLVYPHIRMASGEVRIYPDEESFTAEMDLAAFAETTGWRRSEWDDMQVIQSSADKVHIRVQFSRFNAEDELMASYDSLYIIERVDGRWGVRARSSFAP